MRSFALALISALLVGCSTSAPTSVIPATPAPSASGQPSAQAAHVLPGGCGSTAVLNGGTPAWLDEAGAHNNPTGLPYVVASPINAAGFIFGYPLSATQRQGTSNKILWVVGVPRNGSPLEIKGLPLNSLTPTVRVIQPANSSPGEIYPTIVDVPRPGCWHFDLVWSGNTTSVDLMYQ